MTIKYLITAYGQQAHLHRLCTTLLRVDPSASITVQYDQSKDPLRAALPTTVEVISTPWPVTWGDGSYLDALVLSFRQCLREQWDWLALLSGQDYPIRRSSELIDHLSESGAAGILATDVVPAPTHTSPWTEEQRRYWFRHRWIPDRLWNLGGGARGIGRLSRAVLAAPFVRQRSYYRARPRRASGGIGTLVQRPPFDVHHSCRKGSDYFIVSRALAEEVIESVEMRPELYEHFRHCAIPSEGWFQTVLGTTHGHELLPDLLTFSRFDGNQHPRLLNDGDLEDAIASRRFFARKFDHKSELLLDRIDRDLLGL